MDTMHDTRRAPSRAALLVLASLAGSACAAPRSPSPDAIALPLPASTAPASPSASVTTLPPPPAPVGSSRAPESAPPIVIRAVGDIMLGSTYPAGSRLPPAGGAKLLADVTPLLRSADIAFGNLEAPLVDGDPKPVCTPGAIAEKHHGKSHGSSGASCWSFRTPTRHGALLREAGFDVLSVANNHILDFGEPGRKSTLDTLAKLGIVTSGPTGTVGHLVVRGRTIDVIAFATYDTSNDLTDLDASRALVARSAATADIVVVSFHGGAEGIGAQRVPDGEEVFWGEPRGAVRAFARAMVDAGADLVVGHGPHVVRGMEIRNGRLIAYSLGNFATYGAINVTGTRGVSLILEARLAPDGRFLGGKIHPTRQRPPGGPHLDREAAVIPMLRDLSKRDFGEGAPVISEAFEISPPG